MGRIMAIDYGQKRVGIAVTDELQLIPNALTTLHVSEVMPFLKDYLQREKVDIVVVGEPRNMDNTPSDAERFIAPFIKHLQKTFPTLRIERFDERFTSRMAFQTMIDAGLSKKARQDKAMVDRISAVLILQSYLDARSIAQNRNHPNL
ncbi:MAG: Holliday junction resolvase RuvX [Bacteroidales bacterium]